MGAFFDHFLKGDDNGWDQRPAVMLNIRHIDRYELREEPTWPLATTSWTTWYLDSLDGTLGAARPVAEATSSFDAASTHRVRFTSSEFEQDTEITGPLSARLSVSSTTEDADLFVVLHLIDPHGAEVLWEGLADPQMPVAHGWLRASHRAVDERISTEARPFHGHRSSELLQPERIYEVHVEIWPTCVVVPAGYRLALTIGGTDYEHGLTPTDRTTFASPLRGSGPFVHPLEGRGGPAERYRGTTTIHTGPAYNSTLLLPFIEGTQ